MQNITIRSWKTDQKLVEGDYANINEAIEDAIKRSVCLDYADLSGLNLTALTLDEGRFSHIRFCHSNLTGANLSEAVFENCDFSGTTLSGACFAYSQHKFCLFRHAQMSDADMQGAALEYCSFAGLSWARINWAGCEKIEECIFVDFDDISVHFSKPPLVILGSEPMPVILFQDDICMDGYLKNRKVAIGLHLQQNENNHKESCLK